MKKLNNIMLIALQLLAFLLIAPVHADHIVLLHYVKRAERPAIPWIIVQGRFEMGMSMYPSKEKKQPNEKDFYIYLYDLKKDSSYDGALKISIDNEERSFDNASKSALYEIRMTLSNNKQHQLKMTVNIDGVNEVINLPFQTELNESDNNMTHLYVLGLFFILFSTLIRFVKRRVVV